VNVGVDHDTAEFAVASIERWWIMMGRTSYPDATELLINKMGSLAALRHVTDSPGRGAGLLESCGIRLQ
jgi:hypothetical protein